MPRYSNSPTNAIDRAQALTQAAPVPVFPEPNAPSGCAATGCSPQINPAQGTLTVEIAPISSGDFDARPILTYSSASSTASEFGNGWGGSYQRKIQVVNASRVTLTRGDGSIYPYTLRDPVTGIYTPPSGAAANALQGGGGGGWTETQPDGMLFEYDSSGVLQYIANNAGARWTLTHDGGGRVTQVKDDFGRTTSFAYDGSNKIRRISGPGGRITSYTVNNSGNLVRITSPELCVTTLGYDVSNRLTLWMNPLGDRTSYIGSSPK